MDTRSKSTVTSFGKETVRSGGREKASMEPRITRRMSKAKTSAQATQGKCVICLGSYDEDRGALTCGHVFCRECLIKWWRNHPNCPFCRQEILYIETRQGLLSYEDIPEEQKEERDEFFVPHCELCWGEIEEHEEMNICTVCRGVYWHRRCLPFKNIRWYCLECAGNETEEEPKQDM